MRIRTVLYAVAIITLAGCGENVGPDDSELARGSESREPFAAPSSGGTAGTGGGGLAPCPVPQARTGGNRHPAKTDGC